MRERAQAGLPTRRIVIFGILAAAAIFLGATSLELEFIPNPFTGVKPTIGHIPIIVGAILEGPVVGAILGMIFGLSSFFYSSQPILRDRLVAIVPPIFVGVFAAWTYLALRRAGKWWAIALAAIVGTATNTVLVVGLAVAHNYWTKRVALNVAISRGIPEVIIAVVICFAVMLPWERVLKDRVRARV